MSSDLNVSVGPRPAPVVRSATEWAAIRADFGRSGLSRREFCESRELSLKPSGNGKRRFTRLRERIAADVRKQKPADKLGSEAVGLETIIETARTDRKNARRHCRVGDLDETERRDALPSRQRLFLDVIRVVAYRAETRMMLPVILAQGKKPHSWKLLRSLMTSDADILPDPGNGILRVHIPGLANDACDRQIDPLLSELDATETVFPGSGGLRMVYEVDKGTDPAQTASHKISRDQEV